MKPFHEFTPILTRGELDSVQLCVWMCGLGQLQMNNPAGEKSSRLSVNLLLRVTPTPNCADSSAYCCV